MNPQEEDLVEVAIDLHNEQMEVIPPPRALLSI
jgi:hypothetical protein